MRANEVACFRRLDNMHEDEARVIFFSESSDKSNRSRGAFAEISGIENLAEFGLFESVGSDMRPDGEHRAWSLAKNFFGDRAEQEFADAAAAIGTQDDEVGILFPGDGVDHGHDATFDGDDFGWN